MVTQTVEKHCIDCRGVVAPANRKGRCKSCAEKISPRLNCDGCNAKIGPREKRFAVLMIDPEAKVASQRSHGTRQNVLCGRCYGVSDKAWKQNNARSSQGAKK